MPLSEPIRIKSTDRLGNVAYLHRDDDGSFRCTLANGLPASFFYAGIQPDEMACRFALKDCATAHEALAIVERYGSPLHRYELLEPVPPPAQALFLRLYHGRRAPSEQLDDWGSEGPIIGPLAYVHTTYMSDVKFAAAPTVMDRFFPAVMADWRARGLSNVDGLLCDWQFTFVGDLIEYDGVYYGDWTAFIADPTEIETDTRAPGSSREPVTAVQTDGTAGAADISELQLAAANAIYDRYDFGHSVADAEGWWTTIPGDVFTRAVYLEPDHTGTPLAPVTFSVTFAPGTDRALSAAAVDSDGNAVGNEASSPQ